MSAPKPREQARRGTHNDTQVKRFKLEVVLEHVARHDRHRICNIEISNANTPLVARAPANMRVPTAEGHCHDDREPESVDAVNHTVRKTSQVLNSV
ncbi:hypothetical protein SCLCIDRAFT_974663 [Scleroderma citrinum Foug A]|uniref:Uncharacterized protein n=1 Tax=Scleroderma citrinum Foug A TaxID=1036808 RepID=A0A0C3DGZ6_9AGAM|nr:hypothetical protein SCLCIDRAFT_974663 [Scleroderma citrinum Foug A]